MLRIIFVALIGLAIVKSSTLNDPNTFDVASFNIQVFGVTKMGNPNVAKTLVKIIKRFDLILIQEIRDSSGKSIIRLLNEVNVGQDNDKKYKMVQSGRLGRTTSKEQYAAIYREDWVVPIESYTYADPNDVFEREPHIIKFNGIGHVGIVEFAVVNIHTSPGSAQTEIDHLVDVYDDIISKWGLKDVLIMGDFNADCDYVNDWKSIRLAKDFIERRFYWLIDDTIDTTTKSTDCTYDRIVVAGHKLMKTIIPMSSAAFHFDKEYNLTEKETEKVSDHYPVSIQIRSLDELRNSQAFQSVTVRDSRVTRYLRRKGNENEIWRLRDNIKLLRWFKNATFYDSKGNPSVYTATRGNMKPTSVAIALNALRTNFPDLIEESQYYQIKRLVRSTNPLRYIPRGHGRYLTLYDYYKVVEFKYRMQLECVLGPKADCWISIKRELPK